MRGRLQPLAALLILALVAGGGVYLQMAVGPRAAAALGRGVAPSGGWFCPHGGGPSGWLVKLSVANPGSGPVRVRVQDFGAGRPSSPAFYTVGPDSELQIPAAADGRGRASIVEYFGGWVAAGWVARGGGGDAGVAAEPCLPQAGRSWLLPDGTTERGQDAYVVVMNPFAADAVFTMTLFTERRAPIEPKVWSDYVLPAYRSVAFHLNTEALGERTVSAEVDVKIGRVAAASLGISSAGGIRSAVGLLGPPSGRVILPGGTDQGRTDLVVMNPGVAKADFGATLLGRDAEQVVGGLEQVAQSGSSAMTYPASTRGPSTIDLRVAGTIGVAAVRRTYGINSDQGSTGGVSAPGGAWVVLPATAGPPFNPGVVLSNPGGDPARVTLSFLSPSGTAQPPAPIVVSVPAGRTVEVPRAFVDAEPTGAVLAVASEGTFVPAAASYSLGKLGLAGYAVAVGVPIPPRWIPK